MTITPATGVAYAPGIPDGAVELLAALDPPMAAAVITAAVGIVERAGDLWDALLVCSPSNTARPAIEILTDIALTSALPLTEGEQP